MSAALAPLAVAGVAGAVLGGLYFGALWWTVHRLPRARRPGPWLLASAVLRVAALLPLLFLASGGRWERLVAALVGFMGARTLVLRWGRGRGLPDAAP